MRCQKPNTDQEAVLTVYANGLECPEYIYPHSSTSDPNVLECLIPVSDGDQLTLDGHFSGTALQGAFDLVADGAFICDKRIEGSKTGEAKYIIRRKLEFSKVLDSPIPPGWTSIYPSQNVVEGNMHVVALDEQSGELSGGELGVGCLAVIMSVNQKSSDPSFHDQYPTLRCGEWTERDLDEMCDGGVAPTHEIEVKVTDNNVHKNKQSKHRRHFGQTRFGLKPWAKFIFYYRSHMAIESAGCVPRPDKVQKLEPAPLGSFAYAERKVTKKKAAAKPDAGIEEDSDGEEVVVARGRQSLLKQRGHDGLFVSESPSPDEPNDLAQQAASPSIGSDVQGDHGEVGGENGAAMVNTTVMDGRGRSHHGKLNKDNAATAASIEMDSSPPTADSSSSFADARAAADAGEGSALKSAQDGGAPAASPPVKALVAAAEKYAQNVRPQVRVKEEPREEVPTSTTSSTSQPLDHSDEHEAWIQFAASSRNNITAAAPQGPVVAANQGGRGRTHEDSSMGANAGKEDAVKIKLEPTDLNRQPETATPSVSSAPVSSPRLQNSPNPLLKRAGSTDSTSCEGTLNKRPRIVDLEAKKAALAAQIQKKRQRKAAALEAEQKKREKKEREEREEREREEALMREIEMLEKENAEEDEGLEEVLRGTEPEEMEM